MNSISYLKITRENTTSPLGANAYFVKNTLSAIHTGEEVSVRLAYALRTKDRPTPPMLASSKQNQMKILEMEGCFRPRRTNGCVGALENGSLFPPKAHQQRCGHHACVQQTKPDKKSGNGSLFLFKAKAHQQRCGCAREWGNPGPKPNQSAGTADTTMMVGATMKPPNELYKTRWYKAMKTPKKLMS